MNTNADNAPAPGMTGQVITHNLPSYTEKNDAQGLEDAAGLPFGNDAVPEDEERRSSNQTSSSSWSLFNFIRCNKIILGSGIGVVLLLFVTWISSAALTSSSNSSMVVESFNGSAGAAKASKAPTAKASKVPKSSNAPNPCMRWCWDTSQRRYSSSRI